MFNDKLINGLKGMAMGLAEIVPGVSGGTIALITGIYEKLIYTIKCIDKELVLAIVKWDLKFIRKRLDLPFLFSLLLGMVGGIIVGVFGITYLFENFPEPLWGFFFGLILASCIYVGKKVDSWSFIHIIILFLGALVAYYITTISPVSGNTSLWYVYLSGTIAICALILPGISGSFILLLLGMYSVVIQTLKAFLVGPDIRNITILLVFALGCLTGITVFSRVMNFLFNKYPKGTLTLLIGFMLGSLNKIWPWRNVSEILDKASFNPVIISRMEDLNIYRDAGYKVLSEVNVFPAEYWMGTSKVLATILSLISGFVLLFAIDALAKRFQKIKSLKS